MTKLQTQILMNKKKKKTKEFYEAHRKINKMDAYISIASYSTIQTIQIKNLFMFYKML